MNKDCLNEYLNELVAFAPEIPSTRKQLLVDEMIVLRSNKDNRQSKGFLTPIPANTAAKCIYEIFRTGSKTDNEILLKTLISEATITSIPYVCEIMEYIERGYGRLGESMSSSEQFIEESCIIEIERLLIDKIKQLAEVRCLFDFDDADEVRLLWRFLEKETFDVYTTKMIEADENIPKYLSMVATYWHGSRDDGWSFKEESFSEVISKEDALQRIQGIKNTERFSALAYKFKQIAIAFYFWCTKEGNDAFRVTGSEQEPKDICTDRIIGTRKGIGS